jgi:hypothetical protein
MTDATPDAVPGVPASADTARVEAAAQETVRETNPVVGGGGGGGGPGRRAWVPAQPS